MNFTNNIENPFCNEFQGATNLMKILFILESEVEIDDEEDDGIF